MLILWTLCLHCYAVTVQHEPVHMTLNQNHLTSATHANISNKPTVKQHQTSLLQDERSLLVKRDSRAVLDSEKKKKKKKKKKKATPFDCWDIVKDRVFAKKKKKDDDDEYTCLQYPTPFFSKKKCCQYCPFKNPFWPADKCKTKNPELAGGAKIDYFTSTGAATECDSAKLVVSIGLNDLDDGASMVVSTWNTAATGGAAATGGTCYAVTFTQGTGTTAIDGLGGSNAVTRNILPASVIAECDRWGGGHLKFFKGTTCTTGDTLLGQDDAVLDHPAATTCQALSPPMTFSAGGANDVDADKMQKNFNAAGCTAGDAKIEWFISDACDGNDVTFDPFWYVNIKKRGTAAEGTTYWKSNSPLLLKTAPDATSAPCYNLYAPATGYGDAGDEAAAAGSDGTVSLVKVDGGALAGAAATAVVTIDAIGMAATEAGSTGGVPVTSATAANFLWGSPGLSFDCTCSPTVSPWAHGQKMRCNLHPAADCTGDRSPAPFVPDATWATGTNTNLFGNLGWCDASGCYGLAGDHNMGECQAGATIDTGGGAAHTPGYGTTNFKVTSPGPSPANGIESGITTLMHGFRKTFKTKMCAR